MAQAKNSPTVALARALELARTTPGDITDRVDGLSLRLYRTAAGVSSLAVAAAMGRSAQAISSIESRGASSDLAAEYLEAVDTAAGS